MKDEIIKTHTERRLPKGNLSLTGFTLIETLIYAVLFSIIIGLTIGSVYQIIEGSGKLSAKLTIENEAHFLVRKIEWALTDASVINSPPAGVSGTSLSVNKTNFPQNPIVFDLDSGNMRISRAGGDSVILNSENVTVSNLDFNHLSPGLYKPAGVDVSFEVDGNPYSTTIYLRK